MKRQVQDLKDEERIEREEQQLKEQYRKEMEDEKKKLEKAKAEKEQKKQLLLEGPTKEELARMKLEEELAKKEQKKQEQQERLDRLYQKMTEEPQSEQRAASPPIPTLRNRNSLGTAAPPKSPPIPVLQSKQGDEPNIFTTAVGTAMVPLQPSLPVASNFPAIIPPLSFPQEPSDDAQRQEVTLRSPPDLPPQQQQFPMSVNQQPVSIHSASQVEVIPVVPQPVKPKHSADVLKGLSDLKSHIKQQATSFTSQAETQQQQSTLPLNSLWPQHPTMAFPQQRGRGNRKEPNIVTATPTASGAFEEFSRLKYQESTSSRMKLWQQYPEPPRTSTALELQQDALLSHQQQQLNRAEEMSSNISKSLFLLLAKVLFHACIIVTVFLYINFITPPFHLLPSFLSLSPTPSSHPWLF